MLLKVRENLLILSRKVGQSIIIGDGLRITLLKIHGQTIRLGFKGLANKKHFQNISARVNQKIQIGNSLSILVAAISGQQVRLGIDIPPDIKVMREELDKRHQEDID
jgi:carbon storage regulator CsrA